MTHALVTGPIRGTVTLENGKVVDVRPDVVWLDSQEEAHEAALLIGDRYEKEGHPFLDGEFKHNREGSIKNFKIAKGELTE